MAANTAPGSSHTSRDGTRASNTPVDDSQQQSETNFQHPGRKELDLVAQGQEDHETVTRRVSSANETDRTHTAGVDSVKVDNVSVAAAKEKSEALDKLPDEENPLLWSRWKKARPAEHCGKCSSPG